MKYKNFKAKLSSSIVIWNYVLSGLLLVVISAYVLVVMRLAEQRELLLEGIDQPIVDFQVNSRIGRNLARWSDSSLTFDSINDFQAGNNGRLPNSLAGIPDPQDDSSRFYGILREVRLLRRNSFGLINLPDEKSLHIWLSFVCDDGLRGGYQVKTEATDYNKILKKGQETDFTLVYGTEEFYVDGQTYIKCLDSRDGPGTADSFFKQIEMLRP